MREKHPDSETRLIHEVPLRTLDEAEDFLYSVLPNSQKALYKEGEGFYRSRYFMRELGNPQDQVKSVHIAGTSGKGSTVYYISGLLSAHGFNVGTHVSPHMYDMRERAMLNMSLPREQDFLLGLNDSMPVIKRMDSLETGRPTYFEVTLGNAFLLFARENVDYAVIETGIGGRYDSTNTINRQDKLAVITQIGLDHTEVLGDTIEKISYQKAGILPMNGESIVLNQNQKVKNVFCGVATERRSKLRFADVSAYATSVRLDLDGVTFNYDDGEAVIRDCNLPTIATYQVENAALAIYTLVHLSKRDGFEVYPDIVRKALSATVIPGRSEVLKYEGNKLLMDGAHNPQKIAALVESLRKLKLDKPPIWIFAAKNGKDVRAMVGQVAGFAKEIHFTQFFNHAKSPHLRKFAVPAADLGEVIASSKKEGIKSYTYSEPHDALRAALGSASHDDLIVISGSIYLLGEINQLLSSNNS